MDAIAETTGRGLSTEEAARRLERYGPNQIAEATRVSLAGIFLRQFTNLLIVILLVAAAIAALMGETVDAIAILLVVLLNGILGFVQEWRTENSSKSGVTQNRATMASI